MIFQVFAEVFCVPGLGRLTIWGKKAWNVISNKLAPEHRQSTNPKLVRAQIQSQEFFLNFRVHRYFFKVKNVWLCHIYQVYRPIYICITVCRTFELARNSGDLGSGRTYTTYVCGYIHMSCECHLHNI